MCTTSLLTTAALLAATAVASGQAWPPVSTPHLDLGAKYGRASHGDMDGDGHTDLVLTTGYTGMVWVAFGNGVGAFRRALPAAAPAASLRQSLVVDLDGDGVLDVAALQWIGTDTPGAVHVLRGDGTGGLAPISVHGISWSPRVLASADLDGDGDIDLVASCEDSDGVSVLRGAGDGRFARHVRHEAGQRPFGMTLGDVTGDGIVDALVTSELLGTLHLLSGDGAAGFLAPEPIDTSAHSSSLALGDLDGDGDLDLVSGTTLSGSPPAVHENVGGSLVLIDDDSIDTLYAKATVALGDLDDDGTLDLVTRSAFDLRTALGDGRLGFTPAGHHDVEAYGIDLIVDDLDGDSLLDVGAPAGLNSTGSMFTLLRGTGTGTLRSTYWDVEDDTAVVDFDADGVVDLAAFRGNGDIVAMGGLPGGGFGPLVQSDGVYLAGRMEPADFDGDGLADLVISGGARPWLLFGQGELGFTEPQQLAPTCNASGPILAVGDVDTDGDIDIVASCFYKTTVYLGAGDGGFVEGESYPPPAPFLGAGKSFVGLLDVDGDGPLDLLEVLSGQVATRRGNGDGSFEPPLSSAIPAGFYEAAVADVDRDGDPDVAVAGSQPDTVALLLNDGSGVFVPGVEAYTGTATLRELLLHDLDGDGLPDLVAADAALFQLGTVWCMRGGGDGTFGPPAPVTTSQEPRRLTAVDLDGDGLPELVVAGNADTTVHDNLGGH